MDTDTFNTCLDSGKFATLVQNDATWIQGLGVRGTPAFVVNGQPLVGLYPFESFQQIIEAEISANEQ